MAGVYIHIPFCKQACSYCDFYFVTQTSERETFVEQLIREIESYHDSIYAEETIKTIYFGGGTPSLLSSRQIAKILKVLDNVFKLDTKEITLEMNPDDVTSAYLEDLNTIGITRSSMGIQTFQPELLTFMNRAHTRQEALTSLDLLSRSGFESFTVDLIYGNPSQTNDQLHKDLDILLQFSPPHVSAYSLTIEPKTRLGKQVELGRIVPPEDDKVAKHFEIINQRFLEQGIQRYEVSNYSKPGREAKHNSSYWEHENYLGLGPAAHSFWWDREAVRWENAQDIRSYLDGTSVTENREKLRLEELAEERLMMGLRTRKGVSLTELKGRYLYQFSDHQKEYLQEREAEGKVDFDSNITLTDKGIAIADAIILDLVTLH